MIEVEVNTISDQAICISPDGDEEIWLPRSLCENEDEADPTESTCNLIVPRWWAEKYHIEYDED